MSVLQSCRSSRTVSRLGGATGNHLALPTTLLPLLCSTDHIRVALAFELLSPKQVCALFARALNRQVSYEFTKSIKIEVSIPEGYREQLQALEVLFGKYNAPYFGLDLERNKVRRTVEAGTDDGSQTVVQEARSLWGGWRGIEEYAREVFPVEEANNGLKWMKRGDGED